MQATPTTLVWMSGGVFLPANDPVYHGRGADLLPATLLAGSSAKERLRARMRSLLRSQIIRLPPSRKVGFHMQDGVLNFWMGPPPPSFPELGARTSAGVWGPDRVLLQAGNEERRRLSSLGGRLAGGRGVLAWLEGRLESGPTAGLYLFGAAGDVPASLRAALASEERDRRALSRVAWRGQIQARLRARGLRWYALDAEWEDKERGLVRYWLNPADPLTSKAGWYRYEDLEAWGRGEGPIVRTYSEMGMAKPPGAHGKYDPALYADGPPLATTSATAGSGVS